MIRRFLAELALFRDLEPVGLKNLVRLSERVTLPKNEMIYSLGDPPNALWIVEDGNVAIFLDEVGKPVQLLDRAKAGDWFGEVGLVEGQPRRTSARTTEASRLVRFSKDDFVAFLEDHPRVALRLELAIQQRREAHASALLDVASTKEVRMRIGREAELLLEDGSRHTVRVENLSLGGLSLTHAPDTWRIGQEHGVVLVFGEERVEGRGRVSWTSSDQTGLSFVETSENHEMTVLSMIRALLASDAF